MNLNRSWEREQNLDWKLIISTVLTLWIGRNMKVFDNKYTEENDLVFNALVMVGTIILQFFYWVLYFIYVILLSITNLSLVNIS